MGVSPSTIKLVVYDNDLGLLSLEEESVIRNKLKLVSFTG
jgi:hypothetical protein